MPLYSLPYSRSVRGSSFDPDFLNQRYIRANSAFPDSFYMRHYDSNFLTRTPELDRLESFKGISADNNVHYQRSVGFNTRSRPGSKTWRSQTLTSQLTGYPYSSYNYGRRYHQWYNDGYQNYSIPYHYYNPQTYYGGYGSPSYSLTYNYRPYL